MATSKPKLTPISSNTQQPGSTTNAGLTNLRAKDPARTDKDLLVQLRQLLGRSVLIRTQWLDPEGGESYEVIRDVNWPDITLEQAMAALAAIEATMLPADDRSLGVLLAELWVVTAKPKTASGDLQALAGVYIRELRAWPGDIALAALKHAKRKYPLFPPFAHLCRDCDALACKRTRLRSSLRDRINKLRIHSPTVPDKIARKSGQVSWASGNGNRVLLAKHLGITEDEVWKRLISASEKELAEYSAVVQRLLADTEGEGVSNLDEGAPRKPVP